MARVNLTVTKLKAYNTVSEAVTTAMLTNAVDASEGAAFVMDEADQKYLIMVQNLNASVAKSFTVKAGNGLQGVLDYMASVPALKTVFISIESGKFKNVSGADKGKVVIMGESTDVKVGVVVLP